MEDLIASEGFQRLATSMATGMAGSVVSKILDRGVKRKLDRVEGFLTRLASDLSDLSAKCDDETLTDAIHKVLAATITDCRADKLGVFGMVLKGVYSGEIDDTRTRLFIELTSRFETHHLEVIRFLRDGVGSDVGTDGVSPPAFLFSEVEAHLSTALPELGNDLYDVTTLVMSDLIDNGIVRTRMDTQTSRTILVKINPVGLLRKQAIRLSSLGESYARYVVREGAAAAPA